MRLSGGGTSLDRLLRRPDFLRAARGRRFHSDLLTIQGWRRPEPGAIRIGFTLTRKVGPAVERNRIRRRLRAAALQALPPFAAEPIDLVVVGRAPALLAPFERLVADLGRGIATIVSSSPAGRGRRERARSDASAPSPPAATLSHAPDSHEPETHG